MPDLACLQEAIRDYVLTVDDLYGHYLDTTSGFVANERFIAESQIRVRAAVPPGTDPNALTFFYGHGGPQDPRNRILHRTTQGAYKARNAKGGQNHIRAAQLLLVLLFEYWESEHRNHISAALEVNRDELKVPVLGDLRLLRQDVIHHRGVTRAETVKKLSVLSGFSAGHPIQLTSEQVESIVIQVKSALDALVVQSGGADPQHRKVWRVQ